jgi:hypothetical protein
MIETIEVSPTPAQGPITSQKTASPLPPKPVSGFDGADS